MNKLYSQILSTLLFVFLALTAFAQPSNDVCSGATTVTPDGTCVSGTTVDAADNWQGVLGCQTGNSASNHPDVWYMFVATGTQADFTVTAGTFTGDVELILIEVGGTTCTDPLYLAGSDCGPSPLSSTFTGLIPGNTYIYTISNTPTGTTGTFTSCVTTTTPPPVSGQDCGTAAILCDNSTFSQGSSTAGSGAVSGNSSDENLSAISCLATDERQSLWYKFTVGCSGTLEFTLDPNTNANDYDWAIFDITTTGCAITPGGSATGGSPVVACNYSGCPGNTGISTGDPCAFLDSDCTGNPNDCVSGQLATTAASVTAGSTYALIIDNFSLSNDGFSFSWGANGTATIGPDASFTYSSPSCGVFDFVKTCQTTNSTFLWNFGDGNTATTQDASHTYTSSGTYYVSLEVTDALGCTKTFGESIEVNVPVATATPSAETICSGGTTGIALTSTVLGTTYAWTVTEVGTSGASAGSGSTIAQTLTATGATPGTATYSVTPTAAGCTGVPVSVVITVNPTPTATATSNSPVCEGNSLDLIGGAVGLTYSWTGPNSFTSSSQSPTVSASATTAMAGDYTITVSDGTCTNTATTTVVVNTLPVATATSNSPVCEGTQLNLTGGANGMTSYSWSGPNAFTSSSQSPTVSASATTAMAGTYTITVDDGNCTNTATTSVTVNTLPVATATSNSPVCEGTQLDLTGGANGMTSYSWSGPNAFTSSSQSPTVSASATTAMAGTYTITVDDGTCTNTATTSVTVNTLPVATATSNSPVCEGAQLDLTGGANGMTSYSWSGPNAFTSSSQSPTVSASATTAMAGTYTITVDDGNCTNTATTSVTVNTLPVATATSNSPVCEGAQLDLTGGANGMTSYSWSGPNAFTSSSQSPTVSASATTAMAGTYIITVDDGTCTNTATTSVTVNTLPVATATSNSPVCEGAQLDLTGGANGMTSYSWSGPNAFTSSSQSPTVSASATTAMTGTYTITVDDGTCTNTATTSVTVNTLPVATATSNSPVCEGAQLDLTGGANGMTSYSWSGPNAFTSSSQSPTVSASATTAMAGTYTITVDDGNCTNTATTTVVVNTLPVATATNNSPLCEGAQITLTGGDNGMTSYSWSGPNSYTSTSQSPTVSSSATAAMDGVYTLTVSDGTCSNTATTTVTVNSPPLIDATGVTITDPSSCGATDGSITGITASGTATLTYVWNGGSSQATADISGIGAGSYNLVVTDGNGCTTSDGPYSLSDPSSPAAPTLSLVAGPICDGGSFTIDVVSPDGAATYTWSGPNGYSNTGTSITLTGISSSETGNYTAYATIGGCVGASATPVSVTVNSLPIVDILPPATSTCANPVVVLDGSNSEQGSDTYLWTASGGGALIGSGANDTDSTITAGDYNLLVTNTVTGCTNNSTVTVTSNGAVPVASATASNGGIIDCAVSSITLDGSASTNNAGGATGITFSWATSSGGSSFDTNPTTTVTTAGTYYLQVTETSSGCTDEVSVVVTDNTTSPVASITGSGILDCNNTTLTLDGSGSSGSSLSYEWQDGTSSTVGTSATLSVTTPDTYTLIITNTTNSCTDNTNVTITQDITTPIVVVNGPLVVDCNNPVVVLNGSGSDQGANYTYTWSNPGTGVLLGAGNADTDSTSTADTYTLTVLNTINGCSDFADITVSMDTVSPVADAGTDVSFPCGVASVALDGSASSGTSITYNWSGPGTITNGTTATPSVDATGTFTLTVTESNGCTDTDMVDVIPNSNAPVADAGTDITVTCNDLPWNVALDGSGSDSGANITYAWSTSGSGTITGGTTTTPSVDQEGAYTITVTNTTNSCSATATVNVITDTISPVADAGIDVAFDCNTGATIDLDGSGSIGSNLTFTWSTVNGTIDSQSGSVATVSSDGDYDLTVTADNGCTDSDQVVVTMDTITPVISIAAPDSLDCLGTGVTLDATGTTGTNETYLWSNGDNVATSSVSTAGTYTLTVTNDNGCSSSSSVTVSNVTGPTASFIASATTGAVPLAVSFMDGSVGNGLSYNWDLGDGTTTSDQNPSNTYNTLGDFEVILMVTDNNGCTDSDTIVITTDGETELIIPNIFSPNGDGENDLFIIGQGYVLSAKGVIYNRWGENIYFWNGLNTGWDGRTITGEEVPEGVYYYIYTYEAIDGTSGELTGFLHLNR